MSENQEVECQQQPVATRTRRISSTFNINAAYEQNVDSILNRTSEVTDLIGDAVPYDDIMAILKKDPAERVDADNKTLNDWSFLVPEAQTRLKAQMAKSILKQRAVEQEEPLESIEQKANVLAQLIEKSHHIVIYTGAGISTSASIPDYRGPNGLWTQIRKTGAFSITKLHDLTLAEPTLTHMAIKELSRRRIVKHVVSQNCDGLHLRSGIAQSHLSEIHGDMYIEVCPTCEKQYFRQADITEKTSRFRHKTGRKCHTCAEPNNNLIDTIVLYGERSRTQWPMNWERASKAAKRADLIICMGSSLKTLRRYNCLWPKTIHGTGNKEPETKLVIINLQYTPKDKNAVLKINGKCDLVMQLVMQKLNINIPAYEWTVDPLLKMSTPFTKEERANLKRNLIFESRLAEQQDNLTSPNSPNSNQSKRPRTVELSKSPSLFVSELTDDPEKKRLRMRIRAVNADGNSNTSSGTTSELSSSQGVNDTANFVDDSISGGDELQSLHDGNQEKEEDDEKLMTSHQPDQKVNYILPGWLGKSLGATKTKSSSYRRKRHGNKGRRHLSVLKRNNESAAKVSDISNNESSTMKPLDAVKMEPIPLHELSKQATQVDLASFPTCPPLSSG